MDEVTPETNEGPPVGSLPSQESNLLQVARSMGFHVRNEDLLDVDLNAARMLPASSFALGVSFSGGVLETLVDSIPAPAQFHALERSSGASVTITVTTPALLARARRRTQEALINDSSRSLRALLSTASGLGARAHGVVVRPGSVPTLTTPGGVEPLGTWPVTSVEDITTWVHEAFEKLPPRVSRLTRVIPLGQDRWRVTLLAVTGQPSLLMRRLDSTPPTLAELGAPAACARLAQVSSGLILVSGPAGSGRSSTARALALTALAHHSTVLLEVTPCPEVPLNPTQSPVLTRHVGVDVKDIKMALDDAPSTTAGVVLIDGDLDTDSWKAALNLASSGVLVIATCPGVSSSSALSQVASLLVGESVEGASATARTVVLSQLSQALVGVVSQRMMPAVDGLAAVAFEVVPTSPSVRAIVANGNLHRLTQAVEVSGSGVIGERSLAELVRSGRVEEDTARSLVVDVPRFEVALGRLQAALVETGVDLPLVGDTETSLENTPKSPEVTSKTSRSQPSQPQPAPVRQAPTPGGAQTMLLQPPPPPEKKRRRKNR